MVAVPGFFAVTTPLPFTAATLVSELSQTMPEASISDLVAEAFSVF